MDKYKIVKRLEYCAENKCDICQEENGSGFPWIDGRCYGFTERLYDALALLKVQEPIAPVEEKRRGGYFRCGNCNARVSKVFEDKYCSQCGRPVKWE